MRLASAGLLLLASLVCSSAQEPAKKNTFAVPDRINKALDERIARLRTAQIEADCKAEAKKQFPGIHWKKRRTFLAACIEQAKR
jgi:hypothetical protein